MIWSLSWKNVWRNKTRSLVVIIAVTLGIISGVLLIGIMEGWVAQRLHDAIYNEVSHVQIHNTEYLKNEELDLTIVDSPGLVRVIDTIHGIKGWVERTRIVAMLNTSWASTGVIIYGIDPEKEKVITEVYKRIVPGAGEYLDKNKTGSILISDKIAELLKLKQYVITENVYDNLVEANVPKNVLSKLDTIIDVRYRSPKEFREEVRKLLNKKELDKFGNQIIDSALDYRIRNKIQITISDLKGTPVQSTFRVCGIYKTTNGGFDQSSVFVNSNELAALYDGNNVLVHEIAILLDDIEQAGNIKETLTKMSAGNTANSWKELAPDAAMMNDYMIMYYFIFIGIVMLALGFGIINTMMMSILERTRELGMLMAIGMNKRKVFSMIMLETIFLTMVGAASGMALGWLIVEALGKSGIHFSSWGEGFEAIGFAAVVYPVIKPAFFMIVTILVILTAIIASIWPARKALKLVPVDAIRTE
jgi:putative ABC transport system permease protein